jgi:signal transduction histidine kinase
MSTFLVHDLKNTASALSLTLSNLPAHFDNPEFREDALRTLTKSVGRVKELIARLTLLRRGLELHCSRADLNQVVESALKLAGDAPGITIARQFGPLPSLWVDVGQIESVMVNLVLNAREAMAGRGEVHIETGLHNGGVHVMVRDGGCGMTAEFMSNSLFRPFKTSKKSGLGIGMFQAKTIVEAHGGKITVRSEPGKGSSFRIWLPLTAPSPERN